jgi:pantoate--beta-alanine ligase
MKVINTIETMRIWSQSIHLQKETIAFVPSMGYLHGGHLSLIRKAKSIAQKTVVSIFVNPAQFGPGEDLEKYPRDVDRDLILCKNERADAVFLPQKDEMYSPGHFTYVVNEQLNNVLCGRRRPGHFKGVTTIVAKLFNIIDPDISVFGQKDAQQAIILKNMVKDLNFRTKIIIGPIIREADGLALSSRNKYLNSSQRRNALILSASLQYAEKQFASENKNMDQIKEEIIKKINATPECKVDYVEFVNAETLLGDYNKGDKVLLAIAVFVGETRLIDNTILTC